MLFWILFSFNAPFCLLRSPLARSKPPWAVTEGAQKFLFYFYFFFLAANESAAGGKK